MATCDVNTLLRNGKVFQSLEGTRSLQLAKTQLICDWSSASPCIPPGDISDFFVFAQSGESVGVIWNPSTTPDLDFQIQWTNIDFNTPSGEAFLLPNAIDYVITGLSIDDWQARIRARNAANCTSNWFTISFNTCIPSAPENFNVDGFTNTAADLSWTEFADPLLDFEIQWSQTADFSVISGSTTAIPSARLKGIVVGSQAVWYVRIRARNSAGCFSDWVATSFDNTV